jgi:hypothetical protein
MERMGSSKSWAVVGVCSCWETENAEANAHLIAAAPDLLAALVKCREQISILLPTTGIVHDERMALACADAAIAKATGESA